jgi:hypothetical protein
VDYLGGSAKAETSVESRDKSKHKALWDDSIQLLDFKKGDTPLASLS